MAVLLLTQRSSFESAWSASLARYALSVRSLPLTALGDALASGTTGVIVDMDGHDGSESDLLAALAQARARSMVIAIALGARRLNVREDLLLELAGGLLARSEQDLDRIAAAIAHRADPARRTRFAHLSASAPGSELVAIFEDARVLVLPRPWSASDSGAPVEAISLFDGATAGRVELKDGASFVVSAAEIASGDGSASIPPPGGPLGDIDGVRLGQRLRALRVAAGLTQAELARRTGIHRPNIARVEAGRHTPSLETLARLAAAIGVSTTRVLSD